MPRTDIQCPNTGASVDVIWNKISGTLRVEFDAAYETQRLSEACVPNNEITEIVEQTETYVTDTNAALKGHRDIRDLGTVASWLGCELDDVYPLEY